MKRIYSIIVFVFLGTIVLAQNVEFDKANFKDRKDAFKEAVKNLEKGDEYFEIGLHFFKEALPFYERANEFNPNNAELNYKLGRCYLVTKDQRALSHLEKALKLNPNVAEDLQLYLGEAYHKEMRFDDAIAAYSQYQKVAMQHSDPYVLKDLNLKIKQCYNGKKITKKPIRVFIDNLGDNINTKYNEYGAVISADESVIVFTSRRPGSVGGKIDPNLNEYFEDIYIAEKNEDGTWGKAVNIGEPVNTPNHDANTGISPDGQRFLIYIGKKGNGDIYESVLDGKVWGKPESLGKNINTKDYHEPSACYSPDEQILYFVSDKPGGKGGHDIYYSKKDEKGNWGEAINIGDVINTPYDEEAVYMHPDGKTLYFSSQGHESIGGFDIFKSVYDEKTKTWSKPENIGYPVNTTDDDVFFVVSASGRHGYYTSTTKDGRGLRDLYMVTFLGKEKNMVLNNEDNLLASQAGTIEEVAVAPEVEVPEARLTILKGIIYDFKTNEKLKAEIEIVDNETNEVIARFHSNSATGKYLVSLPAGKNYGIAVKKEGYLFHSENFNIPDDQAFQTVEKNIGLKKLSVGNKIVLNNIFFDLDKATLRSESTAELERLIKLMKDNPTIVIEIGGHTDSQGSNQYNQSLSERRAKAVVDYLIKGGINSSRMTWKGYGETKPIATNATPEGRQKNRRTEFKIIKI